MAFCAKCGSALAPNAGFCPSCGTAAAAASSGAVAPKKSSKRKMMTIVLGCFVVVLAVIVFGAIGSGPNPTTTNPSEVNRCDVTADSYLEMLKRGDSDFSGYWKPGAKVVELYSVKSYTELNHGNFLQANNQPYKIARRYYQYDVESSTKGGFAIRKRWDVVLEPDSMNAFGKPCAIVDLLESQ